jgi:16S rRNA (guanine1207-N2)-methyltransferase
MDAATQLLLNHLRNLSGPALWIADEQIDQTALTTSSRADLFALSNRCDVASLFKARGISTILSDFDLAAAPSFAHALFRVAKEKALVHHIINAALETLPPGGTLTLSGYKGDGTKTYIEKAATRAQGDMHIERGGGALLGRITRGSDLAAPLDDQHYAELRQMVLADNLTVWSKPGIFGWKKIDEGSRFLFEYVDHVWGDPPQSALDLGCGYGYLSISALRHWPDVRLLAVDNNIAAVGACARNLLEFGERTRIICSDAGGDINEKFDAILCNPPFHQGFAHASELTEKFLHHIRRLLAVKGRALLVVNQFIAIETTAAPLFGYVKTIARNKSFKLVVLGH